MQSPDSSEARFILREGGLLGRAADAIIDHCRATIENPSGLNPTAPLIEDAIRQIRAVKLVMGMIAEKIEEFDDGP